MVVLPEFGISESRKVTGVGHGGKYLVLYALLLTYDSMRRDMHDFDVKILEFHSSLRREQGTRLGHANHTDAAQRSRVCWLVVNLSLRSQITER